MGVTTEVLNAISCDYEGCRAQQVYMGDHDDFWGTPSVPDGWEAFYPPKHGQVTAYCPRHVRPPGQREEEDND